VVEEGVIEAVALWLPESETDAEGLSDVVEVDDAL
jgi:hypothetical protein